MACTRCGAEGHTEYGADGLPYCNSCIFYGLNKPCFKCRMYVPSTELQQYKGQWVCPYCLMDMRDEEERSTRYGGGAAGVYGAGGTHEQCERCGRELHTAYYYRGRRLCESCVEDGKREWGDAGSERPPMAPLRVTEDVSGRARKRGIVESIIGGLLVAAGLKRKDEAPAWSEIVALNKGGVRVPEKRASEKMRREVAGAKPMGGHEITTGAAAQVQQEKETQETIELEKPAEKERMELEKPPPAAPGEKKEGAATAQEEGKRLEVLEARDTGHPAQDIGTAPISEGPAGEAKAKKKGKKKGKKEGENKSQRLSFPEYHAPGKGQTTVKR